MSALKLNLGCGRRPLAGFVNVDVSGSYDLECDLSAMPWPWPDGAADEIVASHILEHFDRAGGERFLAECRRVLTKGGVLHLAVPDMDKFIDCRLSGDYTPLGGYRWTDLNDFMGGGESEPDPAWRHRYMYCFASLAHALGRWQMAGRRNYARDWDNPDHAAFSLYVDAIK